MRLTREESRERTRERLIEAARIAVARQGYDATSIGDIAESAGFTKGAFFSNFESKEALLLELLRRHKADEIAQLSQIMADCDGTVSKAVELYIERLDTHREWMLLDVELQLYAGRTPSFAARYTEVQQANCAALGALIAGVFERAGRRLQAEPERIAGLFLALIEGLVLSSGANPERPPFSDMVKLVLRSLLDAAPAVAGVVG